MNRPQQENIVAGYPYINNYLKSLDEDKHLRISEKITQMGERPGKIEERLDKWLSNFRGSEEKALALKLFLKIDYFSEERIEELLETYKTQISQVLADRGKGWRDAVIITPGGNADSSHAHAYKLTKRWNVAREDVLSREDFDRKTATDKCLIFFNDTHGTGNQFLHEFSDLIHDAGAKNCFIVCISITEDALQRFKEKFPELTIIPDTPTPTLFESHAFTPKETGLLTKLGNKVYPKHPMGFGDCGLLAAYHFQCPNNNIPVVWANGINNACTNPDTGIEQAYPWEYLFEYNPKIRKAPPRFDYDVFLSHNSADKPRGRRLAELLKDAGLRVWFDDWELKAGDDSSLVKKRGLENSRALVLCMSANVFGSDWVRLERSTMLFRDPANAERRFIPLFLDACKVPDSLRRFKALDWRDENDGVIGELAALCKSGETLLEPALSLPNILDPALDLPNGLEENLPGLEDLEGLEDAGRDLQSRPQRLDSNEASEETFRYRLQTATGGEKRKRSFWQKAKDFFGADAGGVREKKLPGINDPLTSAGQAVADLQAPETSGPAGSQTDAGRDLPSHPEGLESDEVARETSRSRLQAVSGEKEGEQQEIYTLARKLQGHTGWVNSVAVSPDGQWLVSGSKDKTVKLWDLASGECRAALQGHDDKVNAVAITLDGQRVLSASNDKTIRVWDAHSGKELAVWRGHEAPVLAVTVSPDGQRALSGCSDDSLKLWHTADGECLCTFSSHSIAVWCVAISPDGKQALSGSHDNTLKLWDLDSGDCLATLEGHSDIVYSVVFTPDGHRALSGSDDKTIKLWDLDTAACVGTFEGHQGSIDSIALFPDGVLLASTGFTDHTLRLWDVRSGACVQVIKDEEHYFAPASVAFSPDGSHLVAGNTTPTPRDDYSIYIYHLTRPYQATTKKLKYTNAKIVLMGETGVGKSGLAHRLIEDRFVETHSTHGMKVWPLELGENPAGEEREALLWDLAGQEDYRLIHQLFLDETALALLLFNPQKDDPFAEAGDWLKALDAATRSPNRSKKPRQVERLLLAARTDVGGVKISERKIRDLMAEYGIADYLSSSAKNGDNCSDALAGGGFSPLKRLIAEKIPWDSLPWTSTPQLLRELKSAVLAMRDEESVHLLRFPELAQRLRQLLLDTAFDSADARTAVTLLANHGLIMPFAFGDLVLLRPELLNGYASAVIQAARNHLDEIGCVAEAAVFGNECDFSNVERLIPADEDLLLRAMVQTFLDKSLCIAENTPDGRQLIFPSQYRRERPFPDHPQIFVSYRFCGEWQTVYTTLVVRLWYSREFDNKELWYNAAEFTTLSGKIAGLVLERRNEGETVISAFFEAGVSDDLKTVFIEYLHRHLQKYAADIRRERRYVCQHCDTPVKDADTVQKRLAAGKDFITCQACDEKVPLLDIIERRLGSDPVARKVLDMDNSADAQLDSLALEQILTGHCLAVCGEASQIYRPNGMPDLGIHGEIEFRNDDGTPSGHKLYVYLHFSGNGLDAEIRKARAGLPHPVFVVLRDKEGIIRWSEENFFQSPSFTEENAPALDAAAVWGLRDKMLLALIGF
ncbi:MAG: TIR domain-containing protein [Gammaproteobacteria bacterium]|nr:TIR domain-containing protein [Gammaproteobacteria bacterium]